MSAKNGLIVAIVLLSLAVASSPVANSVPSVGSLPDSLILNGDVTRYWYKHNDTTVVYKEVFTSIDLLTAYGYTHVVLWDVGPVNAGPDLDRLNETPSGSESYEANYEFLREAQLSSSTGDYYVPQYTWKKGCPNANTGSITPDEFQVTETGFLAPVCERDENGDLFQRTLPLNLIWIGDTAVITDGISTVVDGGDWKRDPWYCPKGTRYVETVNAANEYVMIPQHGSFVRDGTCWDRTHLRIFEWASGVMGQAHFEHSHNWEHYVHDVENSEDKVGDLFVDAGWAVFPDNYWLDNQEQRNDHDGIHYYNWGWATEIALVDVA